jgi:hypothetical protein
MTAKRDADDRLDDIVSLAQSVIARAKAAQVAIAKITAAPPERKDDKT